MCVHNGKLFCVGNFEKIGGVDAGGLASWDGNQWCGYGANFGASQPYEFVGASYISFFRDTMYVSGGFMFMDSIQVNFITKWVGGNFVDTCGTATGIFEPVSWHCSVLVFPNPSNTITTFQFPDHSAARTIVVTDNLGREIWRKESSEKTIDFPAHEFARGMYFYIITENGLPSTSGKFLIEH
jgi:hypothetical protein